MLQSYFKNKFKNGKRNIVHIFILNNDVSAIINRDVNRKLKICIQMSKTVSKKKHDFENLQIFSNNFRHLKILSKKKKYFSNLDLFFSNCKNDFRMIKTKIHNLLCTRLKPVDSLLLPYTFVKEHRNSFHSFPFLNLVYPLNTPLSNFEDNFLKNYGQYRCYIDYIDYIDFMTLFSRPLYSGVSRHNNVN